MSKVHLYSAICAPTISQIAALEALRGPQGRIKKLIKEYNKRRKFIIKRVNETPCFYCACEPKGAFYIFPKLQSKMSSVRFAHWLIKNARVLVVPGTDFGRYGEGYVRLSYATRPDFIERAMNRIERAIKKLKQ